MADGRPLLLVDVDGVVCPYAGELADPGAEGMERATVGYSSVWLARGVADRLQLLTRSFELIWCTAWEDDAATFLAPHLGLPEFPVIHFDEPIGDDGHWKWPSIEVYVGDRPFAWLDDELRRVDFARAERRSSPTLLVRVEGTHGLSDAHVVQLAQWSREVSSL